nr:Chain G, Major structural protein 1 [Lactococcus phage Tuc2009]
AELTKITRGMQNGAETINDNLNKLNTITVQKTGDETIAGKKTFSGDVSVDGDFTMKKFADSYVAFFANKGSGNTVTFTAPWDCTAEVELFYHGWGYSGGEWEIGITTPSGLTQIYEATGYTNGHDNQAISMPTKAIYSGLKKGLQYTFDIRDANGRGGGPKHPMMIVKLYRNA